MPVPTDILDGHEDLALVARAAAHAREQEPPCA